MEEVRLQKFLAECGIASRRKCEEFIEDEILLDDEDDSDIFDNELAEDNLENDNDSFEE